MIYPSEDQPIHPPTQETTALAVEECVNARYTISAINLSCFGGFRSPADDPTTCSPNKFFGRREPWRRWVWFLGTTGLSVGLHKKCVCLLEQLGIELFLGAGANRTTVFGLIASVEIRSL